jgi:hypothetical protein
MPKAKPAWTPSSTRNRRLSTRPKTIGAITASELPAQALLRRYQDKGAYTDCYVTELNRPVELAEYVEAFYTTFIFKLERLLLSGFLSLPSTDAQARELAIGAMDKFAAWKVEGREANQVLLGDYRGRTCSWLMVVPGSGGGTTRLYFGSAVVPVLDRRSGKWRMGFAFRALLGFHKLYSRMLLSAAADRLGTRAIRMSPAARLAVAAAASAATVVVAFMLLAIYRVPLLGQAFLTIGRPLGYLILEFAPDTFLRALAPQGGPDAIAWAFALGAILTWTALLAGAWYVALGHLRTRSAGRPGRGE